MPALSLLFLSIVPSLDLDPAKTDIQFTLRDALRTVHGAFRLKRGSVHDDPDSGKVSGAIVADVPSGASGNATPDCVDGKLAPEGLSQIDVHGVFNIHADHELMRHFQVERAAGRYIASKHFTIPYVQWGMKDPSNFPLKVDKTVDIDIRTTIDADR